MSIILVGLNHKTAPVEVRERLAFSESALEPALRTLVSDRGLSEALIISTCNRVEILGYCSFEAEAGLERVRHFLHEFHHLPTSLHNHHLYGHSERTAVRHLFRVAASLDSMVVGESQVLGQVKTAYSKAAEVGTIGRILNQLMARTFSVAKRVRSETEIGVMSTSISSVAVDLAKKIFDNLAGKAVLLVGAGEMIELAAQYLLREGVKHFLVCNRTYDRAQELATQLQGEAVEFGELSTHLAQADIVLCSTGATDYVVTMEDCKRALEARRNRPIFFIDISVPRNVDPAVSGLDNIFLFDIDDLEKVVSTNLRLRQREASKAESIIEREVDAFFEKIGIIELGPTIAALKEHLTELALAEYTRSRAKLGPLSPEQEEAIKQHLLGSLVNKFMHPLIVSLREGARTNGDGCDILELYHNVYNLKARLKLSEEHEEV
ncbi:MAG: glutamyl-tRNA reductase [Acidobacteriota bacterium]